MPWARLGVARVELASGNATAVRRALESLIGDLPEYADSYDVMGHVLLEQGEIEGALNNYRRAASLTRVAWRACTAAAHWPITRARGPKPNACSNVR